MSINLGGIVQAALIAADSALGNRTSATYTAPGGGGFNPTTGGVDAGSAPVACSLTLIGLSTNQRLQHALTDKTQRAIVSGADLAVAPKIGGLFTVSGGAKYKILPGGGNPDGVGGMWDLLVEVTA